MELLNRYEEKEGIEENEYDIMPIMFHSIFQHSSQMAQLHNKTTRHVEICKKTFEKNSLYANNDKHNLIHVQDLLALSDFAGAENTIETNLKRNPKNIFFQFFKGLLLKSTDRKKDGNKILRAIESDDIDMNVCHDMNHFGNMLFNKGLDTLARLMIQEASKLHIFLSQYQRPVLVIPKEIDSQPIWDKEHVGLSTYDDEFAELKEFLPTLKQEALKATENITHEHWIIHTYQKVSVGNYIYPPGGNLSNLPLFTYGKRRLMNCLEVMPETCKFMKSQFPRPTKFNLGTVKLTAVDPKTKTLPMDGMTNVRLRILVPVQIPQNFKFRIGKDTEVPFKDDFIIIDDSFEHQYDNENSDEKAIWLSIDILNPDFTMEEAQRLSATSYAKAVFLPF